MTRRELTRLAEDRICFVCRSPVPEGQGLYIPHLRMLVHHHTCGNVVKREERDYTVSKRGRRRPASQVVDRIEFLRAITSKRGT